MRLSLLAHLLLDAVVDLAGRLLVGVGRGLLLLRRWAPPARGRRWRWTMVCVGRRRRRLVLRCAFVVDALLRFALLALPFGAALFVFHHVLAQFAIGAEQAAIGYYEFRFLLFVWHRSLSLFAFACIIRRKGNVWTVALCSPICTVVPGAASFAPHIAQRQGPLAAGKWNPRRAGDLSHIFVVGANFGSRRCGGRRLALQSRRTCDARCRASEFAPQSPARCSSPWRNSTRAAGRSPAADRVPADRLRSAARLCTMR